MKKNGPKQEQFNYGFLMQFSGLILFIVGGILTTISFMGREVWGEVLFLILTICMGYIAIGVFFGYSTLSVGEDGVAVYKFGLKIKSIRWKEIKKIKKHRFWNQKGHKYSEKFYIYDNDKQIFAYLLPNLLKNPIVFMDKIHGINGLINQINGFARQYGFPLYELDREKGRVEQQVTKL